MPNGGNEAEWLTRRKRIDTKLRSLNPAWQIITWHEGIDLSTLTCHAVTEFPTANGPADYAFFVNSRLLGINEAKKVSVNPQNVIEQAKRYSSGAFQGVGNWNGCRVPFLFSSKDDSLEDANELPEPQDLAAEAITELEAVVDDLREIVALVEKEEGVEQ